MGKCASVNDGVCGSRGSAIAWAGVKELRAGLRPMSRPALPKMTKADGSRAETAEQSAQVFADHFEKLYGRRPTYSVEVLEKLPLRDALPGLDHDPTDEEIRRALRRLHDTAPGASGLAAPLWKALGSTPEGYSLIRMMALHFWETEEVPVEWEVGILSILAKKGNLSLAGNYRGIMMLECAYKIVANLILERLHPVKESLDIEPQSGFRRERGSCDAIFSVRQLIAKRREHGLETWLLFVDLVKAFDRVPRELLWEVMRRQGVPHKIVSLLKALHASVHVEFEVDGVKESLLSIIGVKQGDLLGPDLFIFYIAAIMETWKLEHTYELCTFRTAPDFIMTGRRPSARGEEFTVADSEYADDTALPFCSRADVEEYTPKLMKHFERWGMEIHAGVVEPFKASKSEVLFCAARASSYSDPDTYDGADLSDIKLPGGLFMSVVDRFKYLGSYVSRSGDDTFDVDARIESAGKAFGSLRGCIFSSTHIAREAKTAVYTSLVLGILLYGAESWSLTEAMLHRLRTFHARCVRSMHRVTRKHTWDHHISTQELEQRLGLETIDFYISRRQLRWLGHVSRMGPERLPRQMLSCWVPHPRPRGAPQLTYGRGIDKALWKFNIDRRTWPELAADRAAWRETLRLGRPPNLVVAPPTPPLAQRRPSRAAAAATNARIDAHITEARGGRVPAPLAAAALARLPPPAALGGSDTAPLSLALQ